MGKIVRNGVEYGGSSNSAETIKYNETKNVKDVINEIKSKAMFIDSFDTDTGTLNTTSVSPSSDPTAASVTFDNANTGLNATNVQDAVTEVNGNLNKYKYGDKIFGTSSTTIPANSWSGQWFPLTVPEGYTYFTALCGSNNDVVCGVSVANYDAPNNRLLVNAHNRHTQARDFSHVYMIPIFIKA